MLSSALAVFGYAEQCSGCGKGIQKCSYHARQKRIAIQWLTSEEYSSLLKESGFSHYEHRDEQKRPVFSYLCEGYAQKKLAEWLQCAGSPDYVQLGYLTDFDIATVFYEQKNDAETLLLTHWRSEQKRRRLQVAEK